MSESQRDRLNAIGRGIRSLSLGGDHGSELVQKAGKYLLKHPLDQYIRFIQSSERCHYSCYYYNRGMCQSGGDYWRDFFPSMMETLVKTQRAGGSWLPESNRDDMYGGVYTIALSLLKIGPVYQVLPIYQR